MNYVNGTTTHDTTAPPIATAPGTETIERSARPSPERAEQIKARLLEPFDPTEIKWRVTATATTQTKRGPQKRGQLVAYADQRAYTDRLNDVFGEWGWTRTYNVQVAQNFERRSGSDRNQTAVSAKVVVVSTVMVHGLGAHTGVGEEWADDENAATRAEAQAFKRACACFGLGRYLYDLDKVWVDLDQYNRPTQTPALPDWVQPRKSPGTTATMSGRQRPAIAQPRQGLVQQETLAQVNKLCETVGFGLSCHVLRTYGGVADPAKVGFTKLTAVMERLCDIANGIARLRTAADQLGRERYAQICRELNLPSDSIDDIPDRNALRTLVTKVEESAAGTSQGGGTTSSPISDARGRLLQSARKAAESGPGARQRSLGEVIAAASNGELKLETLNKLTEGDVARVDAVTARINEG